MKKDKIRAPSPNTASKQLALLRTKQEWHERLAREHAAPAKRLWLRRVLLELSQKKEKGERRGAEEGRPSEPRSEVISESVAQAR